MQKKFSKTSKDILLESKNWSKDESKILKNQTLISQHLNNQPFRNNCLLCRKVAPKERDFLHRNVEYFMCSKCNHIQTLRLPPDDYPHKHLGKGFETIYPKLSKSSFQSRRDRIYLPKLEWIISVLEDQNLIQNKFEFVEWLELGCGAGYFLNALQSKGIEKIKGFDENSLLVKEANRQCTNKVAFITKDIFQELDKASSNIVCAFFVLEHINNGNDIWKKLSSMPKGTIFVFSVPTFSFSTVLECGIDDIAARNLDNVLHTQIYTDQSIDYCLEEYGFKKCAEWLFGQDSQELCSMILKKIKPNINSKLFNKVSSQFERLIDPIQEIIDKSRFCDARHIIAIKS